MQCAQKQLFLIKATNKPKIYVLLFQFLRVGGGGYFVSYYLYSRSTLFNHILDILLPSSDKKVEKGFCLTNRLLEAMYMYYVYMYFHNICYF